MHDKPSAFTSRCFGRIGCKAGYEKLKITLKQKTISQISRGWDGLRMWELDCKLSLSSFRRGNSIALTRFDHVEYQQRRECLTVKKKVVWSFRTDGWKRPCTNTNEHSDNGNQKPTSEGGVSFKQKLPKIIL